jgi:tetratricopeptide (TPR) repeat protein
MNNQYITRSESYIDSAKAHTQKALELDDQLPEAHLISGDIYRTLNPDDVHRAISEYILSARLNPTLSSPIQHLIRFYNELGNFREAEIWGEKFIQIQPCNALGYIEMGLIKWFQGRLEDAIHYYDKAIEIEPAMSWCYGQKGYCMLLNGKWDEAKTLYMKNLELDQKSTQALASLGRIAFIQSQPEQAIAIYHTLLEAGADGFDHFILIQILRSRGETPFVQKLIDLGFAVCRKNLVKSPHDHRWLADLAILNALAGDRVAAERNISEAKKTRDFKGNFIRKNRVLFREAVVYSVLKNHQKAISILEQVVAMRMYSRNYLKESIEFMDLRDDPDFIRLVNSQSASF